MEYKTRRILVSSVAVFLVGLGLSAIALFNWKRSARPLFYSIQMEKEVRLKKGHRISLAYSLNTDLERSLTYSFSFPREQEEKESADSYLSARIYPKQKKVYLTCEKEFEGLIEFTLSDKEIPSVFAKSRISFEKDDEIEHSAELLSKGLEDSKPLSFILSEEGEPLMDYTAFSFELSLKENDENNWFPGEDIPSDIFSYKGKNYPTGDIRLRKEEVLKNVRNYLSLLSDGKKEFSYKDRKEIRTVSYFGEKEGVSQRIPTYYLFSVFFKNILERQKKGERPLVFKVYDDGFLLREQELGFKDVPPLIDGIDIDEGEILF